MALIAFENSNGIVVGKDSRGIQVVFPESCTSSGGCKNCSGCGAERTVPKITIKIPRTEHYETGRKIIVRRLRINEVFSAIVLFGFPLLNALCVMLAWQFLSPQQSNSSLAVLSGVGALIWGLTCVAFLDQIINRLFPPRIIYSADESKKRQPTFEL